MSNSNNKIWFDEHLNKRKKELITLATLGELSWEDLTSKTENFESTSHPLYGMLQSSGIIYGFPVHYPFHPLLPKQLKTQRRSKIILIDIILFTCFDRFEKLGINRSHEERVEAAGELVKSYYQGIQNQDTGEEEQSIERILFDRVVYKKSFFDFRKKGINSHLFWDWYFFQYFLEEHLSGVVTDAAFFQSIVRRKMAMKQLTIKLLSAAIHADNRVKREEKVLHNQFKQSSKFLSDVAKKRLKKIIQSGIKLERIVVPELDWMARRFLLDICLLATFADREFHDLERQFIEELALKLKLDPQEIIESKIDLGLFLLKYGRKLHFYQNSKALTAFITQSLAENFTKIKSATRLEYEETVGMANTFGKLLKSQLRLTDDPELPSEEELAYAFEQLKDIPKFLPFFSLIFMPVPGITEAYILLAYSIEKLTGSKVRLLPSQFSKMVKDT